MTHVFTVKSNANRKIRAMIEHHPHLTAEDFGVNPVDGGFVVVLLAKSEADKEVALNGGFDCLEIGRRNAPEEIAEAGVGPRGGRGRARSAGRFPAGPRRAEARGPRRRRRRSGARTVGVREMSPGVWRLAYDGTVPGDSRGYDEASAYREAAKEVARQNSGGRERVLVAGAGRAGPEPKGRGKVGGYAGKLRAAEAAPALKAAGAPGKFAAIREAGERGELPPVPDFSADLHKRNRGRLALPVAMAEAGDVAGLKVFPIKPNCTSPKAMDRYRHLCVIALNVRAAKPAAGVGLRSKSA